MSSWTVVTNSARPFLRRRWPETVLALAIAGYVTLFAWKQYLKLYALHYPDFDLAIFYQGVWLLSRGETPFVTVRGLHLFADHATFVNLLLALPMRLVAHPLVLLWAKTAALGLAALPLYSIARRELESRRQALAVAACYLLHPAVHHLNLDSYHTSAFAVPLGLLVWLAAAGGRPRLLIASALALVLVKENMGLVLASLGLLMWVRGDRRGRWVAAGGIAATLLIVTVVIPAIAADHDYIYGGRMTTARAVLSGELGIAEFVGDHLVTPANLVFLRDLTVSLGFLPWASPVPLVLNPMLGLSLASDWPYAKEILYHYTSGLLPSLFLAFVFGWGRVRDWLRRRKVRWRLAATCVAVLTMSRRPRLRSSRARASDREVGPGASTGAGDRPAGSHRPRTGPIAGRRRCRQRELRPAAVSRRAQAALHVAQPVRASVLRSRRRDPHHLAPRMARLLRPPSRRRDACHGRARRRRRLRGVGGTADDPPVPPAESGRRLTPDTASCQSTENAS